MPRLPIEGWTATSARMHGREIIALGGCNYLGLAHHPDVILAMKRGADRYGLTTTASRETTGNTDAHEALERELAAFLGMEAAIVTPEGYSANLALGQALGVDHRAALIDATSHRSVWHMATIGGMEPVPYKHLDCHDLREKLGAFDGKRVAVLTDGVFAADGGVAPVDQILSALPLQNATLVVDDCHGFCVLGPGGRGVCAHFGVHDPRVVITSTLAKGLGAYGGVVAGPRAVIDRVREHGWLYRSTTPVPPPMVEAAREALRVIQREPQLLENLRANVGHARRALGRLAPERHLPPVPIFTFQLRPHERMPDVERDLARAGYLVPLIDYPGGPKPNYFRLTVSAMHTPAHIEGFGAVLRRLAGPDVTGE